MAGNERKTAPLNNASYPQQRPQHEHPVMNGDHHKSGEFAHRRVDLKHERPLERERAHRPIAADKHFVPASKVDHGHEELHEAHRVKPATTLEGRDHKHHNHHEPAHKQYYPSQQPNRKDIQHRNEDLQLREKFEEDGFGTLNPKVIEEILGLREIKISLMKQLNRETSNYNRVILENRQILNENRQLKNQITDHNNSENVSLVEKLAKENQHLKERVAKLELELQKSSQKV